jgi:hypothetical protein
MVECDEGAGAGIRMNCKPDTSVEASDLIELYTYSFFLFG